MNKVLGLGDAISGFFTLDILLNYTELRPCKSRISESSLYNIALLRFMLLSTTRFATESMEFEAEAFVDHSEIL